jgi:hypothetical protein
MKIDATIVAMAIASAESSSICVFFTRNV